MIIHTDGMKQIEANSGRSVEELMEEAGKAVAKAIEAHTEPGARVLFLCGKGNNGGDAFVAGHLLQQREAVFMLCEGKPNTPAALQAYEAAKHIPSLSTRSLSRKIHSFDVIVDAVYGFGYHGALKEPVEKLFRIVNKSGVRVFSIDINSGCEADSGYCDPDALHSEITFALDCYKPFHMMRKDHKMFASCELLDLHLPHPAYSPYVEMNEELFFASFPHKEEDAYKGTFGQILIASGSYGMAGALSLNILGAKTVGASYIHAAVPKEIYPIAAAKHITPVFHPFDEGNYRAVLEDLMPSVRASVFGSGAVYMPRKSDVMDILLQESKGPVVLDAEGLNLLQHNTYILRFVKCPVILTPHIGEFARLINKPIHAVMDHRMHYAETFARENNVILVLKGPNTIVVSPAGEYYINQSGNQALAQAGSGDLLAGILGGMLSLTCDVFKAVCMAVWLHGFLAEEGCKTHSIQNFPLEEYPRIMDEVFRRHGF